MEQFYGSSTFLNQELRLISARRTKNSTEELKRSLQNLIRFQVSKKDDSQIQSTLPPGFEQKKQPLSILRQHLQTQTTAKNSTFLRILNSQNMARQIPHANKPIFQDPKQLTAQCLDDLITKHMLSGTKIFNRILQCSQLHEELGKIQRQFNTPYELRGYCMFMSKLLQNINLSQKKIDQYFMESLQTQYLDYYMSSDRKLDSYVQGRTSKVISQSLINKNKDIGSQYHELKFWNKCYMRFIVGWSHVQEHLIPQLNKSQYGWMADVLSKFFTRKEISKEDQSRMRKDPNFKKNIWYGLIVKIILNDPIDSQNRAHLYDLQVKIINLYKLNMILNYHDSPEAKQYNNRQCNFFIENLQSTKKTDQDNVAFALHALIFAQGFEQIYDQFISSQEFSLSPMQKLFFVKTVCTIASKNGQFYITTNLKRALKTWFERWINILQDLADSTTKISDNQQKLKQILEVIIKNIFEMSDIRKQHPTQFSDFKHFQEQVVRILSRNNKLVMQLFSDDLLTQNLIGYLKVDSSYFISDIVDNVTRQSSEVFSLVKLLLQKYINFDIIKVDNKNKRTKGSHQSDERPQKQLINVEQVKRLKQLEQEDAKLIIMVLLLSVDAISVRNSMFLSGLKHVVRELGKVVFKGIFPVDETNIQFHQKEVLDQINEFEKIAEVVECISGVTKQTTLTMKKPQENQKIKIALDFSITIESHIKVGRFMLNLFYVEMFQKTNEISYITKLIDWVDKAMRSSKSLNEAIHVHCKMIEKLGISTKYFGLQILNNCINALLNLCQEGKITQSRKIRPGGKQIYMPNVIEFMTEGLNVLIMASCQENKQMYEDKKKKFLKMF